MCANCPKSQYPINRMLADPGPGYPLVLIMPGGILKKLPEQPWERALELNNGFD